LQRSFQKPDGFGQSARFHCEFRVLSKNTLYEADIFGIAIKFKLSNPGPEQVMSELFTEME
jgi:hypothetical protein